MPSEYMGSFTFDVSIKFKNRTGFLNKSWLRKNLGILFMKMASFLLDCDIDIDGDFVKPSRELENNV